MIRQHKQSVLGMSPVRTRVARLAFWHQLKNKIDGFMSDHSSGFFVLTLLVLEKVIAGIITGSWISTVYTRVLPIVNPADNSRSIFDPVIPSSCICSPYKSRSTSEVLVCQFLKNVCLIIWLKSLKIRIILVICEKAGPGVVRNLMCGRRIVIQSIIFCFIHFVRNTTWTVFLREYTPTWF